MREDALTDEVRSTYDAVAETYASRFPTTEPEQAIDLATLDHFVARLTRRYGGHGWGLAHV